MKESVTESEKEEEEELHEHGYCVYRLSFDFSSPRIHKRIHIQIYPIRESTPPPKTKSCIS